VKFLSGFKIAQKDVFLNILDPCPAEVSGGNENWKNDTFQAIPFEGANKHAIKSRFSSSYWSVNLTFIMYNIIGIPKDRLRDFILDLQDEVMLHYKQKYRAKSRRYLLFVKFLEKLAASKMLDSKDQIFSVAGDNRIQLSRNTDLFFSIFNSPFKSILFPLTFIGLISVLKAILEQWVTIYLMLEIYLLMMFLVLLE
jgi:hypothetical protein